MAAAAAVGTMDRVWGCTRALGYARWLQQHGRGDPLQHCHWMWLGFTCVIFSKQSDNAGGCDMSQGAAVHENRGGMQCRLVQVQPLLCGGRRQPSDRQLVKCKVCRRALSLTQSQLFGASSSHRPALKAMRALGTAAYRGGVRHSGASSSSPQAVDSSCRPYSSARFRAAVA